MKNGYTTYFSTIGWGMGLLLLTATGGHAQVFGPVSIYGPVAYPVEVRLCDINLDGIPDIVTANNAAGGGISILLGAGNGQVGTATTYITGPGYSSLGVAIGDINGDKRPDIIAGSYSQGEVTVLLGKAGGFGIPARYATGGSLVTSVGMADVTGDGRADVVANNTNNSTFGILPGVADGTLMPAVVHSGGPPYSMGKLLVRDINGDKLPDIVLMNSGLTGLGVALGHASGTIGPMQSYPTGNGLYYAVDFGDMNGDNFLDAVVCGGNNNHVGVLLGQSNGFGPMNVYPIGPGARPEAVATGDVDGDGLTDIVTFDSSNSLLAVLLGQAAGGFGPISTYSTGGRPGSSFPGSQLVLGDMNGDDRLDAIVANDQSGNVAILLGQGQATPLKLPIMKGMAGDVVALTGIDLTNTTQISFTGTENNTVTTGFTVNAAGSLISEIVVPTGAKTGPVSITTPKGTVRSQQSFIISRLAENVHLYPNPTRSMLKLGLPPGQYSALVSIRVLNAMG